MSEPRHVGDVALQGMLEARADRMPEDAGREVLAAARDEIRAPRGGATFAVLPVTTRGRGARAPAGLAAVAVVAVLVLAVAGGRLDLGTTKPAAPGAAAAPPISAIPGGTTTPGASPTTVASPLASAPPASQPAIMTAAQLRAALADGSLDGRLVLVEGKLQVVPMPCPSPAGPGCFGITVPGLDGVSMTWDVPLTQQDVTSMQGTLTFVVDRSTLGFIGHVDGDVTRPISPLALATTTTDHGSYGLVAVSGWLLVNGIHSCPMLGVGATPCPGPGPVLTDSEPTAEGMATSDVQVQVTIASPALHVHPAATRTPGPFLLRTTWLGTRCADGLASPAPACLGGLFPNRQLIARYDPASVIQVVQIPSTCAQPAHGVSTTLTCDAAFVAALDVVPAGTSILALEFTYGGGCPPWVRCLPGMNSPNVGRVAVRVASPGPDLWVVVVADKSGVVTAAAPVPFPAWWGTPSATP